MNCLRWVMDGPNFWEVDVSTPITLDGVARPLAHDGPLPLGLSRGIRLSRPKQLDFLQRFMAAPFVPSYSQPQGFSLHRALTLPFPNDWFATLLGTFNLQKFVSSVKSARLADPSWLPVIGRQLSDKSFYAFGLCSEFLVTSDDTLLLAYEARGDTEAARKKAVFHHKFPNHNLTLEATIPGLFIDEHGRYWDIPLSVAADLASVSSDLGTSVHTCLQHISGSAKQVEGSESDEVPASLLPGLHVKNAISMKKDIDFWRSRAKKLKLVQPYDVFLSDPHVSATGVIGAVTTTLIGHNAPRLRVDDQPEGYRRFNLGLTGKKTAIVGDLFASLSLSAQLGNFQKLFFDLSRFQLRLDVPSGCRFLSAAGSVAQNVCSSQQPPLDAIRDACPKATFSLQQQLVGPFSVRVDSAVAVQLNKQEWKINLNNPVFAVEYALQALGSAKAIAWYAPKQKEFMVELRFFETAVPSS